MTQRKSLPKIKDSTHYYPHQLEGVRKMANMGSLLLADEMGLGKSLEALTVAAIDFQTGKASKVLVVSPASLKGNWAEELNKFTNFSYDVLTGARAAREGTINSFDRDVLIVNYEQVQGHAAQLNAVGFDIVIYDEAHFLKNPKAKRTRACHSLRADRHLLLTGSPLLNQVNDLWSLLHRIAPGDFPKYWAFLSRYAVYGGYQDKEIVGVKNIKELTEKVNARMVRRLKKDVLDLPDKQHIDVWVDLRPEQKKLYKQAVDELQITLPDDPQPDELENALKRFTRLKQICGTTACIPGYGDFSAKLDVAVEKITEIINDFKEPVVVFTQFLEVMSCLDARLLNLNHKAMLLYGDVPADERVPMVKEWERLASEGDHRVLIVGLQVGGVGMNMTAANKCIFVDELFVPKLNEQAEDRLHRIGADATQPVQIIRIRCRNTIEQRIVKILERKEKTFGQLIKTESAWKRKLFQELMQEEV